MLDINKVYNDNSFELIKQLDNQSVDLVVTDPPYGISYSSFRTKSQVISNDSSLDWVSPFFELLSSKVKLDSHLYCFTDFEMMPDFVFNIRKYWKVRNLLCIPRSVKGNGGDRIYQQQFEYCIFATMGQGRKFNETQILKPSETYLKDKRYSAKEWLYRLPDYWHWTTASAHNHNRYHPNEKNVECLKHMIALSSNKDDLVLDPFVGSGSSCIAALNINRNFIGIELDEVYFNTAQNRINKWYQDKQDNINLFSEFE